MNILQGSNRYNNQISLVKNGVLLCCCNSIITSQVTSTAIHLSIYSRSNSWSIYSPSRYLYQIICPNRNGQSIWCDESSILRNRSYINFCTFLFSFAFLDLINLLADNLYYSCSYNVYSYLLLEMVLPLLNPEVFDRTRA